MILAIHLTIVILTVLGHWWYVTTCCKYDSSIPYDPTQLPRLEKKLKRVLHSTWLIIGLSTVFFFIFN